MSTYGNGIDDFYIMDVSEKGLVISGFRSKLALASQAIRNTRRLEDHERLDGLEGLKILIENEVLDILKPDRQVENEGL